MAKVKTTYVCGECGWESPKWLGQCRSCSAWGTLEENSGVAVQAAAAAAVAPMTPALPVTEVDVATARAFPSGISEFDRVLGRGITPGAVILLAGEPGVGKSTLLLDISARFARMAALRGAGPVLYATGEETTSQIRLRAERIGALTPNLLLAAESDLGAVLGHIRDRRPSLIVVDSVQTLTAAGVDGGPGGVSQVKAVTSGIIQAAKESHTPTIVVGHVTKDGSLAGPRTLEHLVDVVCQFEGDRHTSLRLLRAVKNRYGATDEVGCFQLTDEGIEEVPDPSGLFMSPYSADSFGTCVTVTLEGNRPLTTEIQSLVNDTGGGSGRRTASGVDQSRIAMVLAVLQTHLSIPTRERDVYVSTVGGARAFEPAADLAVALAVVSAVRHASLPPRMIAIGEVGLTGDVRGVGGLGRRLQEAARLGFRRALVPGSQIDDVRAPRELDLVPIRYVKDAQTYLLS